MFTLVSFAWSLCAVQTVLRPLSFPTLWLNNRRSRGRGPHPTQQLAATGDDKTTESMVAAAGSTCDPPSSFLTRWWRLGERRARKRCPDFRFRSPPGREEGAALSSTRDAARRGEELGPPFRGAGLALCVRFFMMTTGLSRAFRILPPMHGFSRLFINFFFTRRSLVRPLCLGERNLAG